MAKSVEVCSLQVGLKELVYQGPVRLTVALLRGGSQRGPDGNKLGNPHYTLLQPQTLLHLHTLFQTVVGLKLAA